MSNGNGTSDPDARLYLAAMVVVCAALALPAVLAAYPPLHDWPNHVARIFILANHAQDPMLARYYDVVWLPYPNLAVDLVATPIARVAGVDVAGRVFLVLIPALFLFGADRVARSLHGGPSWSVPLTGFLFFNTLTFYGFVNYTFGIGLFLCAWAAWLHHHRRPGVGRFVAAAVLALACYFAHKTALAFLTAAVVATLLVDRKTLSARGAFVRVAVLAAPVLFDLVSPVPEYASTVAWDDPVGKLKGIASLAIAYHPATDLAATAVFAAACVLLARAAGPDRRSPAALAAAAVLVLAFLGFPSEIGGTWAADRRFLLPALVLALLAVRPALPAVWPRTALLAALALVLVRAGVVTATWMELSRDHEARLAHLADLPRGARVYGFALVDRADKARWPRQMGLPHLHDHAVVVASARVNGLFGNVNAQPLRVPNEPKVANPPRFGQPPEAADWATIFAEHDHVFATKHDAATHAYLARRCEVVNWSADVALYRACR